MSFKCQGCGKAVKQGCPDKTVTKRRNKIYTLENGETRTGWEIVEEQNLCAKCVAAMQKKPE